MLAVLVQISWPQFKITIANETKIIVEDAVTFVVALHTALCDMKGNSWTGWSWTELGLLFAFSLHAERSPANWLLAVA